MQDLQSAPPTQTIVPKYRGPHRLWTDLEIDLLSLHWGEMDLADIAKKFGRTPEAIVMKARDLELGSANRGLMTLKEFSRKSGFSLSKIRAAADVLGLKLRTHGATRPGRRSGRLGSRSAMNIKSASSSTCSRTR